MAKNSKFKNFLGIGEEEEYDLEEEYEKEDSLEDDDDFEDERKSSNIRGPVNKRINKHIRTDASFIVTNPKSFDDAKEICDKLKDKKAVFVNLEDVDKPLAQRIVDFLGGSIYALEGIIKKVASAGFIVAPKNISVLNETDKDDNDDTYSWIE